MPRPKRTKVATPEPTTRVAKSATSRQPSEMTSLASSERNTSNSDDSEGLVTKSKPGANRRGVVAPQEDVTMTGALAPEDVAGGRLKPLRGRKRAALVKIAREGDHAKAKIEELRARMEKDKAEKNKGTLPSGDIVPATQESEQQTTSGAAKPAATEHETAAVEERVSRPPTATGSFRRESSVLADFKRRPRQPSLLALVQAKHQQQAEESNSDDSLNDFQPEDHSTPFAIAKSQPVKSNSTPSARTSSLQHSSGSRKRKHASIEPEIQVPASQPSSPPVHGPSGLDEYDIPADEDAPEPSLPIIQSTQLSSQLQTSTLAPPQSSSPPPEPLPNTRPLRSKPSSKKPQPKTKKAATRLQPTRALSPPLSPQSSTSSHPSPIRNPKSKTKTSPLKPLTTATLQNLLPRRRVRAKAKELSAFDIPSSSDIDLNSDEDELSLRRAPKIRAKKNIAKPTPLKNGKGRTSTTYSRKKVVEGHGSDDDDEESAIAGNDENEGVTMVTKKTARQAVYGKDGAAVKGEMRRLAKKFREVDEWALEIEDVTPHSGSSQMVDAR